MKKIVLGVITFLSFIACKQQEDKAFSVSGKIDNAPEKTVVYLAERPFGQKPVVIDSTTLKNGLFELKGISKGESLYSVALPQQLKEILIVNDAKNIKLALDLNNFKNYTTEGSKASTSLHSFFTDYEPQYIKYKSAFEALDTAKFKKTPDSLLTSLKQEKQKEATKLNQIVTNVVTSTESAVVCLQALVLGMRTIDEPEFVVLAENAAKKFKENGGLQQLNKMLKGQQYPLLNKQVPEIALPTPKGDTVKLSNFKGKYVLVDFWASWCGPCRAENPNVLAAYNKFKDKNFTVFGVSLDSDKEDWTNAIAKDNLTWTHVSDLKRWQSPLVEIFKFDGIPFNILIDPTGKIIASGLREDALEKKLEEVLK